MNSKAIRKQLFAAVAMVLVAAVALGSSTYAWFVASGEVTAQGMNVQASAEAGIVISNEDHDSYATVANAKTSDAATLIPASTTDGQTWWHAVSKNYANADANQLTGNYTSAGTLNTDYAKHTFYIKSASGTAYTKQIKIKEVTATGSANSLSSALRVGVKFQNDTNFYIFAPVSGATMSYNVKNATTVTALSGANPVNTTVSSVPANTEVGEKVEVYLWYEGEDGFCNSSMIPTSAVTNSITIVFSGDTLDNTVNYTPPAAKT